MLHYTATQFKESRAKERAAIRSRKGSLSLSSRASQVSLVLNDCRHCRSKYQWRSLLGNTRILLLKSRPAACPLCFTTEFLLNPCRETPSLMIFPNGRAEMDEPRAGHSAAMKCGKRWRDSLFTYITFPESLRFLSLPAFGNPRSLSQHMKKKKQNKRECNTWTDNQPCDAMWCWLAESSWRALRPSARLLTPIESWLWRSAGNTEGTACFPSGCGR